MTFIIAGSNPRRRELDPWQFKIQTNLSQPWCESRHRWIWHPHFFQQGTVPVVNTYNKYSLLFLCNFLMTMLGGFLHRFWKLPATQGGMERCWLVTCCGNSFLIITDQRHFQGQTLMNNSQCLGQSWSYQVCSVGAVTLSQPQSNNSLSRYRLHGGGSQDRFRERPNRAGEAEQVHVRDCPEAPSWDHSWENFDDRRPGQHRHLAREELRAADLDGRLRGPQAERGQGLGDQWGSWGEKDGPWLLRGQAWRPLGPG